MNFTTEAVLINQISKCLDRGNVADAHKLYEGSARSCTAAMIEPLNQLCMKEESRHSRDVLNDLRDLELLIEKTEGSSDSLPKRHHGVTVSVPFYNYWKALSGSATSASRNQELRLLIASLIPRYEIELMNREQLTAVQQRNRLVRLRHDLNNSKKEAKQKYKSSNVVREFALSNSNNF